MISKHLPPYVDILPPLLQGQRQPNARLCPHRTCNTGMDKMGGLFCTIDQFPSCFLSKIRKTREKLFHTVWLFFPVAVFFSLALSPLLAFGDPPSGIQPLHHLREQKVTSVLHDESLRLLLTAEEQETFLRELERHPPTWKQLHDPPGEEHGTRLFALNRQRDDRREGHPLLKQRIAFRWAGILGEYHDAHQGYTVVIGPAPTHTKWGIVRFKPTRLPHEMVAVPSTSLHRLIQQRMAKGKPVEIDILFTGTLVPWESIIYGFSHDGLEQGMIMPVVQVDGVHYVWPSEGTMASNTDE